MVKYQNRIAPIIIWVCGYSQAGNHLGGFMKIKYMAMMLVLAVFMTISISYGEPNLCYEYLQQKRYDDSIRECTREINGEIRMQNTAISYFNRGLAYQSKEQYDQAIADYTKAIELDPKYARPYNNRGLAYKNKGQYDQAIADFTKAIELDPKYTYAYYNRGNAYQSKGQYDQAIADFTKAIELDPKFTNAYYNRGFAYKNKGQYDQAIADYSKAIELDPKFTNAYYFRGSAYQNKGQYDQAIADFTKSIELDPKIEYEYIRLLIATWLAKGNATGALDRLRQHVSANSSDALNSNCVDSRSSG